MTHHTTEINYNVDKFADLQILRYRLNGFEELSFRQKMYVYCLSEATLCGRNIVTSQKGKYNLALRKLLEELYLYISSNRSLYDTKQADALITYVKQMWFANGIHHHYSTDKLTPLFNRDFLLKVITDSNAELPQGLTIDVLTNILFDKDFLSKGVCTTENTDVIVNSASNYYEDVTQDEVEAYYSAKRGNSACEPMWGLNSKLLKDAQGRVVEDVCRIGGRYSAYLEKITYWLKQAIQYAENEHQKSLISLLVKYYETGNLETFDKYSIEWISETQGDVDFINGFIEVYGDPLGIKASWEGIVHYKDKDATLRTQKISSNAQWFEDNSPTDKRFKKDNVKGITANVVRAAMLGGDEYPSTAIGINLPNSEWIRAMHGSKSVTISNITEAYNNAAKGNGFRQEFVCPDEATLTLIDKYANICDDLHTDLHECLGHGSGQLLEGVSPDALKNYGSTIEEARADLYGLYFMADEKMIELNLLPDAEAYKASYYTYMMNGIMTQLTRIKPGDVIEEAHMRNRALIAHWVYEKANAVGAMELKSIDGKTYLFIHDYSVVRKYIAELLCEIQRVKSEGDYQSARSLVENYGVKVDQHIHNEVLERFTRLGISPYKGFVNPKFVLTRDDDGNVTDVIPTYDEAYDEQMLRYSREYSII